MTLYAISRCAHCGKLHGLQLPAATTVCRYCDRRYRVISSSLVMSFDRCDHMMECLRNLSSMKDQTLSNDNSHVIHKVEITVDNNTQNRMKTTSIDIEIRKWLTESPHSHEDLLEKVKVNNIDQDRFEKILSHLLYSGLIYINRNGLYCIV